MGYREFNDPNNKKNLTILHLGAISVIIFYEILNFFVVIYLENT